MRFHLGKSAQIDSQELRFLNLKSIPVKLIYHKGHIKKSIERMSQPVDINQLMFFITCVCVEEVRSRYPVGGGMEYIHGPNGLSFFSKIQV